MFQAFLDLLTKDTAARYQAQYPSLDKPTFEVEPGRVYARIVMEVNGQRHSKYFVRLYDGAIFASASWKKPNFNRSFGTLDTITEFNWGEYEAVAKVGGKFTMKHTAGPYATAVRVLGV